MYKIAVLASGSGSNLQSILDNIDNGNIIYNNPKDGFIKVKSSLFLEQCIQFWVYSI